MKTLLAILNGGAQSPKVSIRHLGLALVYFLGFLLVLLQLRSVL